MAKLTLQDIAAILTEKNGLARRDANNFASAMFTIIQEGLEHDQLVKVKGLGTFKMVDVEARESISVRTGERVTISGHSKVSFTPDATMKELVNKPFSQFETVVLNEGVEFDDLKEPEPEEEETVEEERAETPVVMPLITTVEEETPAPEEEAPAVEETSAPEEEAPVVEEEIEEEVEEEEEEPRPWGRWLLTALGVLALMALSAYGGYYYGSHQQPSVTAVPDTIVVHDTISVAPVDTLKEVKNEPDAAPQQLQTASEAKKVEPIAAPAKTVPAKTEPAKPQPAADAVDKYAQKDARVRLGAYRIIGLDHEVKVLAGQTFYSICRAHLGPDMECYVEVFNDLPQNPKVKEGQVIKIPKLQLKKRKKQ